MKSEDGFLPDYNYHDWSKYMIKELVPTAPHFAAVLMEVEKQSEYDYHREENRSIQVNVTHYFAFPSKHILESWLLRATKANKKFFFFEVKELGQVQLKTEVNFKV